MREWLEEVGRRLSAAKLDGATEREIAEELAEHLEDRYRELRATGVPASEARASVLRELGEGDSLARGIQRSVTARPEPMPIGRPTWRGWPGGVWRDVRHATRGLARSPVYALIAVVVIALGIGVNTVVFTAMNALLLRPPGGVQEPEELVAVFTSDYSGPRYGGSSYPDYENIRDALDIFESVAAVTMQSFRLSDDGWSTRVMGEVVSPGYFTMLGVSPRVGRFFGESDPASAGAGVVISYELWQSRFGGDNGVPGSRITVRGQPLTVIGVAPPQFRGTIRGLRVQLWISLASPASLTGYDTTQRGNRGFMVLGRMHEGATLATVQSGLDVLASRLHVAYPEDWTDINERSRVFTAVPEAEARVPRQARGAILGGLALLIGAVLMVLLVACTNVANMMLSRASVRRSEMGVRMALGATRAQIARHLLVESMLLTATGGAVGVLLTVWFTAALGSARLPVPVAVDAALDLRVLAFAAAITLGTGLLFGLAPALHASRAPLPMLRDDAGAGTRLRARHALLVFQVAASLVLLIAGGLFIRSLVAMQRVDSGFDVDGVVLVRLELDPQQLLDADPDGEAADRNTRLNEELLERVSALPGTAAAALAETVPLSSGFSRRSIVVADYPARPGEDMEVMYNGVTPGYFATMGIRLRAGREFDPGDRRGSPPVAIVSEAFVRRFWPDGHAIGKRVSFDGNEGPFAEVIGVAPDARYRVGLEEAQPYVYYPYRQRPAAFPALLVRSKGGTEGMVAELREQVRAVAPGAEAPVIQTFRSHMSAAIMPQRIAAMLLSTLGLFAVAIAIIGLYGLVAFGVVQRRREFGVRMALGATAADVRRLVIRDGVRYVLIGIGCGAPISIALAVLMRRFLLVEPLDPIAFLGVPLLLTACALLASHVPARRATARDPLVALRAE